MPAALDTKGRVRSQSECLLFRAGHLQLREGGAGLVCFVLKSCPPPTTCPQAVHSASHLSPRKQQLMTLGGRGSRLGTGGDRLGPEEGVRGSAAVLLTLRSEALEVMPQGAGGGSLLGVLPLSLSLLCSCARRPLVVPFRGLVCEPRCPGSCSGRAKGRLDAPWTSAWDVLACSPPTRTPAPAVGSPGPWQAGLPRSSPSCPRPRLMVSSVPTVRLHDSISEEGFHYLVFDL